MKKPTHRPRRKPARLPSKLLRIRETLGLTQEAMAEKFEDHITQKHISSFETGDREPDLLILIRYADIANVCLEVLVKDNILLPDSLPAKRVYHPHK
jgi:transcriptional regulator with XRE-family HTH domain